jgi:hypothetical protein
VWRGVLIPLVCAAIGATHIVAQQGGLTFHNEFATSAVNVRFSPFIAIAFGAGWLGAAILLHAIYFWGRIEHAWRFAGILGFIGAASLAVGWGSAIIWSFLHAV